MRGGLAMKRWVPVLALVAVLGVACGGDDGGTDTGAPADDGGAVTLTASNFAFQPASLTAAAGGTIEFTNDDDAEHSFTAEDAGIDEDVEAGDSTTIDLADVEPGSYDYFCKYHKDTMTGTLEVTG
jgi:plastocyanin